MNSYQILGKYSLSALIGTMLYLATLGVGNGAVPAFPSPIDDDNGNYAFVQEVTPILLGRKPRGALEVKLFSDIIDLVGRREFLYVLMEKSEFREHWSNILFDVVRLQRTGFRSQDRSCFENTTAAADSTSLSFFIRYNEAAEQSNAQDFTMRDVAISAIRADDISTLMRAYLFPLATEIGRSAVGELNYRRRVGSDFSHVYLNRNLPCLGCHNEASAITDVQSGWDRHFPIEYALDKSIFGASFGGAEFDLYNLFRTDQRAPKPDDSDMASDAFSPWGMALQCVEYTRSGVSVGFRQPEPDGNAAVNFAGLAGDDRGVVALDAALKRGVSALRNNGLVLTNPSGVLPEPADPEAALAFEVAMSLVDRIWDRVFGARLTIDNYFPRNAPQRDALWSLTENTFLPDWSLRNLLAEMLLSQYDNRRTPRSSFTTEPYVMPMVFDPWVARDPRQPDSAFDDPADPRLYHNGQGEITRRHDPQTLMRQAASALGKSPPSLFGSSPYSSETQNSLGQYLSVNKTGHRGFDLQTLLTWEELHGLCDQGAGSDWIDLLLVEIENYNSANPLQPLILRDVLFTMKDWLLTEGTISAMPAGGLAHAEIDAYAAIFSTPLGLTPIVRAVTDQIGLTSESEFENDLRQICGAMLQSPQFMMKGISVDAGSTLSIPQFRVCNDQTDCSYEQMCDNMLPLLELNDHYAECNINNIVPTDPPEGDGDIAIQTCLRYPEICRNLDPIGCLGEIRRGWIRPGELGLDCPIDLPRCDPRCGSFSQGPGLQDGLSLDPFGPGHVGLPCCAGRRPIFRPDFLDLIMWLEDSVVESVRDVMIADVREGLVRPLESDAVLEAGNILVLPASARLTLKAGPHRYMLAGSAIEMGEATSIRKLRQELTNSIVEGDARKVRRLVKAGAPVNGSDLEGRTPLVAAVAAGAPDIVQFLLEAGADSMASDGRGNRPLEAALSLGRETVRYALEKSGAQRSAEIAFHKTPRPRLVFVTGPSARKMPHLSGKKYFSRANAVNWSEVEQPSIRQRLKALKMITEIPDSMLELHRKQMQEAADNLIIEDNYELDEGSR